MRHAPDCGLHCGLAECDCLEPRPCDVPKTGRECARCGKVHTGPPFKASSALTRGIRELRREIDKELAGRQPPAD